MFRSFWPSLPPVFRATLPAACITRPRSDCGRGGESERLSGSEDERDDAEGIAPLKETSAPMTVSKDNAPWQVKDTLAV